MRGVGWGPSPGRNPPPSPPASLPHSYFDVAEDTSGAGAGALGDVNWGFADFGVDSHGEGFRGARNCWGPAALGLVPPPAACTDCAEIPPRLRVSRATGASSFYKSAPGSDDETLSPPSFALCAEGTLKSQGAKAARTEQVGARARRAGTLGERGLCRCDNALPTRGDTQSPDPPLCSCARLQDVAGTRKRRWQRSLPAGKTIGILIQKPPEEARARGGTFQQLRFGCQVVGGGNCVARWRNPSPSRGVLEGKKNLRFHRKSCIYEAPEHCFFHQHLSGLCLCKALIYFASSAQRETRQKEKGRLIQPEEKPASSVWCSHYRFPCVKQVGRAGRPDSKQWGPPLAVLRLEKQIPALGMVSLGGLTSPWVRCQGPSPSRCHPRPRVPAVGAHHERVPGTRGKRLPGRCRPPSLRTTPR